MDVPEVVLAIYFEKIKETRKFKFAATRTIKHVIDAIRNTAGADVGGPTYALFIPPKGQNQRGRWLKEDEELMACAYDFSRTVVEFKNAERRVRVQLMDNTSKYIVIDRRQRVDKVIRTIGEKLGIRGADVDEFGLAIPSLLDTGSLAAPAPGGLKYLERSVSANKVDKRLSILSTTGSFRSTEPVLIGVPDNDPSKSNSRFYLSPAVLRATKSKPAKLWEIGRELFLNEDESFDNQDTEGVEQFLFKKRFYFHDHRVDSESGMHLRLTYYQAMSDIISGKYTMAFEQAVDFVAITLQIMYNKYHEGTFKGIDVISYFPPAYQGDEKAARNNVQKQYMSMMRVDSSENQLMYEFMLKTRMVKDYGTIYYLATDIVGSKAGPREYVLGVSREYLSFALADKKGKEHRWMLKHLRSWSATGDSFTWDLSNNNAMQVRTSEGPLVTKALKTYALFIAGKQRFTPVLDDYTDHEEAQIVEEEDSFQHAIASMRKGSTPEPPRLWNNSPPVQQQQAVRPVVVQSPIALETSMVDIAAELEMLSLATGELGSSSVGDGYVNQSAQAGSAEPDSPIALTVDTIDAFNIKLKQSLQLSEVEAELQAAIRTLKTADDIIDLGADESASVRSFQTSAMQVAMDNIRLNMGEFISEVAELLSQLAQANKPKFRPLKLKESIEKTSKAVTAAIGSARVIMSLISPLPEGLADQVKMIGRIPQQAFELLLATIPSLSIPFDEICSQWCNLRPAINQLQSAIRAVDIDPQIQEELELKAEFVGSTCELVYEVLDSVLSNVTGIDKIKLAEMIGDVQTGCTLLATVVTICAPLLVNPEAANAVEETIRYVEDTLEHVKSLAIKLSTDKSVQSDIKDQVEAVVDRTENLREQVIQVKKSKHRASALPAVQLPQAVVPTGGAGLISYMVSTAKQLALKLDQGSDASTDLSVPVALAKDLTIASNRLAAEYKERSVAGEEIRLLALEIQKRCTTLSSHITKIYLDMITADEESLQQTPIDQLQSDSIEVLKCLKDLVRLAGPAPPTPTSASLPKALPAPIAINRN